MEKMTITREEAARLRFRMGKQKALRHLRNAVHHLDAMIVEARGLEATTGPELARALSVRDTTGPGPDQRFHGSGARYPDTGESGETYDVEMAEETKR